MTELWKYGAIGKGGFPRQLFFLIYKVRGIFTYCGLAHINTVLSKKKPCTRDEGGEVYRA